MLASVASASQPILSYCKSFADTTWRRDVFKSCSFMIMFGLQSPAEAPVATSRKAHAWDLTSGGHGFRSQMEYINKRPAKHHKGTHAMTDFARHAASIGELFSGYDYNQ